MGGGIRQGGEVMAANNMRQLIGQVELGYYGGTTVTISKEALDKYNEESSREIPLPAIDYSASRYTPKQDNGERNRKSDAKVSDPVNQRKHSHYFKDVSKLTEADIYRICDLFKVDDCSGATQHALKKLLLPGQRGAKDRAKDLQEAVDTLNRKLEMMREDAQ